ncbi:MAG: adenine deaminase, partial [Bacteroidota bacterium]
MKISGQLVDIHNREIFPAEIIIDDDKIISITRVEEANEKYILPGFIDAHIHIESSMLIPSEFARLAVLHGTVATISDPHEIANVMGVEGVEYMIANGNKVPFWFNFGAPSCVPATVFETAGAQLDAIAVEELLQRDDIKYLTEMMNWPGVLFDDEEVKNKIACAHKLNKPVDGHAPGLTSEQALKYISAGISTDHECFTYEEAKFKAEHGMKILIREGSAAKNFQALIPLLKEFPELIMFCSDDKHPNDLVVGHINDLVSRAVKNDFDLFDVLRAACLNAHTHYKLEHGLLREGDRADFIVVNDLKDFKVHQTFIQGKLVAENGKSFIDSVPEKIINNFNCTEKQPDDFKLKSNGHKNRRVIDALEGQLITNEIIVGAKIENGFLVCDVEYDILKLTVVNRYNDAPPSIAFIKNFGLKQGAIASCVGHDSHNIICVGVDDESICRAVNLIIKDQEDLSATD